MRARAPGPPTRPSADDGGFIPFDRLPAGFAERLKNPGPVVEARPAATMVLFRERSRELGARAGCAELSQDGAKPVPQPVAQSVPVTVQSDAEAIQGDSELTDGAEPVTQPVQSGMEPVQEVLLVRRVRSAGFVPGAYVFPGGRVDRADAAPSLCRPAWNGADGSEELETDERGLALVAYRVAAVRETFEETGVLLVRWSGGSGGETSMPTAASDPRIDRFRRGLLDGVVGFEEGLHELTERVVAGPTANADPAAAARAISAGAEARAVDSDAVPRAINAGAATRAVDSGAATRATSMGTATHPTISFARATHIAHWVTPEIEPRRYDTRFFAAEVPAGTEVTIDERELTDAVWLTPSEALDLHAQGRLPMIFPTIHTLRGLAGGRTVSGAVALLGEAEIPRIVPRLAWESGGVRMLIG